MLNNFDMKGFDVKGFEDVQKLGKDNKELAMKSFGAVSKGFQAIAVEVADYSKKSFEEGSATFEKLIGVKSIEKAVEIQSEYAKSAYEGFVAGATRIGELYADIAKEAYRPFEAAVTKANEPRRNGNRVQRRDRPAGAGRGRGVHVDCRTAAARLTGRSGAIDRMTI